MLETGEGAESTEQSQAGPTVLIPPEETCEGCGRSGQML